ncbi:MAG: translesion DNA synthesis-associated protein ImuA [Steroidobacteraceae bacterium]
MSANSELARLLEHPAIWRGTSAARPEVLPTGFGALDERLPGKGWPRSGLIEILVSRFGIGELSLLLPALAALTRRPMARWCVWVAPGFPIAESGPRPSPIGRKRPAALSTRGQKAGLLPPRLADKRRDFCLLEPFAPALVAHGVVLERVLVVRIPTSRKAPSRGRAHEAWWAFEQSLGSGACDVAMAWVRHPRVQDIRRLQLAAERGRTLGVLFRPQQAAREPSHAALRMRLEPTAHGVCVTLLKSRGGVHGSIELVLQTTGS